MLGFLESYWLYLLLLFVLVMVFIPVRMQLHLFREPNKVLLSSRLTFWFIPVELNLVNPVTKVFWNMSQNKPWKKRPPADLKSGQVNWSRLFSRIRFVSALSGKIWGRGQRIFKKISSRIKVIELNMYTEVGMLDAAQTAVSVGVFWSLLGFLYLSLASLFDMNRAQTNLRVIPNYQNESSLILDYACIFEFRLGHIIIIIYQLLRGAGEIYTLVRRISK